MASAKALLSFAVAAALTGPSIAAPRSGEGQNQGQYVARFMAFGEAQSHCGEYVQAVEAERKAKQPGDPIESHRTAGYGKYQHFVDGFLSGANFADPTYRTVGQGSQHAGRMAWLENYCRARPLDNFGDAVMELWAFLKFDK